MRALFISNLVLHQKVGENWMGYTLVEIEGNPSNFSTVMQLLTKKSFVTFEVHSQLFPDSFSFGNIINLSLFPAFKRIYLRPYKSSIIASKYFCINFRL